MRGRSKEFLRALRKKHGLGEFRAVAGGRTPEERGSRDRTRTESRGSRTVSRRSSTRRVKSRRKAWKPLGLGM